jgi:hypothetical protein
MSEHVMADSATLVFHALSPATTGETESAGGDEEAGEAERAAEAARLKEAGNRLVQQKRCDHSFRLTSVLLQVKVVSPRTCLSNNLCPCLTEVRQSKPDRTTTPDMTTAWRGEQVHGGGGALHRVHWTVGPRPGAVHESGPLPHPPCASSCAASDARCGAAP